MGKVTGPPFIETETPNEFVGATDPILRARVHGDTFDRVVILANGTVLSGSGGSAPTAVGFAPAGSIPLSIIDAAGDLIVGTGADTAARLAKGAALTVLRTNAGGTALEWADIAALFDAAGTAAGLISDTAYNATTWDADTTHAPSKNAVRDKIEALASDIAAKAPSTAIDNTAYDASTWNGDTTHAPSKDAVRDKIESLSGASGWTSVPISTTEGDWSNPDDVWTFNVDGTITSSLANQGAMTLPLPSLALGSVEGVRLVARCKPISDAPAGDFFVTFKIRDITSQKTVWYMGALFYTGTDLSVQVGIGSTNSESDYAVYAVGTEYEIAWQGHGNAMSGIIEGTRVIGEKFVHSLDTTNLSIGGTAFELVIDSHSGEPAQGIVDLSTLALSVPAAP